MSKLTPKLTSQLMGEGITWLSIVSQLFNARMTKSLLAHGMTLGQFSILHHIVRPELKGGTRISDIAEAVEVGQPAVTKAITKFETMGLVELVPNLKDRRAKQVMTTPKAMELLQTIRMSIGPDLFAMFGAINSDEIEGFIGNLKALGKWLDDNRLDTTNSNN